MPRSAENDADFSFLHFSDTHIDPRLTGQGYDENSRSVKTLAWFAERSRQPVEQNPYDVAAQLPSFAIHTGDVLEYGPAGYAWQDFETAVADVACPVCVVPGNHDNTWGEINHLIRGQYGNDSYSFDHGGCHFLCINSAGLLDALPCLDRRTLDWAATDLANVSPGVPLFLAMHHPLSGDAGYASEFDKLRLWELLKGRRVALIMDGHWHTVHHQTWQGIDRVNGGATFGTHTGYNSVTLTDGVLRVMFQYEKSAPDGSQLVPLLEKSLATVPPIQPHELSVPGEVAYEESVPIMVPGVDSGSHGRTWIDADGSKAARLTSSQAGLVAELPTIDLCAGWHFVTARVRTPSSPATETGRRFKVLPPQGASYRVVEHTVGAGVKTRPVVRKDLIYVATTAGEVMAMTPRLEQRWTFTANNQVVHSLSASEERILVGDIDGTLYCLDAADGQMLWTTSVSAPIYAAALVVADKAFVVDGRGYCHALQCSTGTLQWSQKIADYAFEAQPVRAAERLLAGSWDGFLYSIDCATGAVAWKSWCPMGHKDVQSRYYGAADCPPVLCADSLFACDRGWILGQYTLDGSFEKVVQENITAIGVSKDDNTFYAKTLDNRLLRLDAAGQILWEAAAATGRAPTPPVEFGERVAVLSDTGILTVLDARSGVRQFEYSVSPRLFCLSGIGTDKVNTLVMADMDGLVTSLVLDA